MPKPRSCIVDEGRTPWYHCISRCVRRAPLCGGEFAHRKQWIEDRLRELGKIFSVGCAGFAVLDNHLHLLLRLDSRRTEQWSELEVAWRWLHLFPLRDSEGRALAIPETRVQQFASDPEWVDTIRKRLADLSWFMKCLKEPIAGRANHEEDATGAFWEGRFKCIAVLDEASLLATATYIDLNPLAAGVASTPEESVHTSLRVRLDHCELNGSNHTLREDLATLTRDSAQESGIWLLPLDDSRADGGERAGLMVGCTLSFYLSVIDATSRMVRDGKASLGANVAPIFERLALDQSIVETTVNKLFRPGRRTANTLGTKIGRTVRTRRDWPPPKRPDSVVEIDGMTVV